MLHSGEHIRAPRRKRSSRDRYFEVSFAALIATTVFFMVVGALALTLDLPPTLPSTDGSYPVGAPRNMLIVSEPETVLARVRRADHDEFKAALHRDVVANGGWAWSGGYIVPEEYMPRLRALETPTASVREPAPAYRAWVLEAPNPVKPANTRAAVVNVETLQVWYEYEVFMWLHRPVPLMLLLSMASVCLFAPQAHHATGRRV